MATRQIYKILLKITFISGIVLLTTISLFAQQKIVKKITTPAQQYAKEVRQQVPLKLYENLAPGELAPDVVKVDADWILSIVNGVCVVKKGDLTGMIDLKGNFIVPWGKYDFENLSPFSRQSIFNTLIPVKHFKNNREYGFLNIKGEEVIPVKHFSLDTYDSQGVVKAGSISEFSFPIDLQGNRLSKLIEGNIVNLSDRALYNQPQSTLLRYKDNNNLYGYINHAGKVIIPAKYLMAEQFSEGLAAVMEQDQFGVSKWGYIDATGKPIIPYTFRLAPGNFHEGLALVAAAEKTTFNFAYIDKTGKIAFTVGDGNLRSGLSGLPEHNPNGGSSRSGAFFIKNYAFWQWGSSTFIIDKTGKKVNLYDIIKNPAQYHIPTEIYFEKYNDLGIYFRLSNAGYRILNINGLMDFDGNILFPPAFANLTPDYYSNYAIANRMTPTGPNKTEVWRKGVINPQGVYVLILEKPATF